MEQPFNQPQPGAIHSDATENGKQGHNCKKHCIWQSQHQSAEQNRVGDSNVYECDQMPGRSEQAARKRKLGILIAAYHRSDRFAVPYDKIGKQHR